MHHLPAEGLRVVGAELHQQAARLVVIDQLEGFARRQRVKALEGEPMALHRRERAQVVKSGGRHGPAD
jgi:hypothetical protein